MNGTHCNITPSKLTLSYHINQGCNTIIPQLKTGTIAFDSYKLKTQYLGQHGRRTFKIRLHESHAVKPSNSMLRGNRSLFPPTKFIGFLFVPQLVRSTNSSVAGEHLLSEARRC